LPSLEFFECQGAKSRTSVKGINMVRATHR